MNKNDFSKNKGFASTLLALAAIAMSPAKYPDGITPKARNGNKRKATKKGATHIQGEPFVPTYITKVENELDGKIYHTSPALYRRLHLKAKDAAKPPVIKSPPPKGRNVMSQEAKDLLGAANGS